jgi:drug/metabolite transporter (DMT)-like permease
VSIQIARWQALAAAVLFSTGGAAIKAEAFSGLQVSSLRSGIAALVLLAWLKGRGTWSWRIAGIGCIYAATLTLFVTSTKLTTAANAIFLQSTAPLYLLFLGPRFLGERVRPRDLVYLGAVAAGLIFCMREQTTATSTAPNPAAGNLLALACGVAWAMTLVALRLLERRGSGSGGVDAGSRGRGDTGFSALVAGNAIACIVALPFAWPFPAAAAGEWLTIVYLGVVQIGVAYACLTAAMRHLPAFEASLLLLIEPVLNPVWTWLVRGERPGRWTLLGGAVIVAATMAKVIAEARAARHAVRHAA